MKHVLAMFIHEKLSKILTDRSREGSAIEWLCVDVDGCKIINAYKPSTSQLIPTASQCSLTPVLMLVILTASTRIAVIILIVQMENALPKATSLTHTFLRMFIVFFL